MKFFHVSHTDMDGYTCQLISKKIFPNGYFLNANYGLEVKLYIQEVLNKIKASSKEEEILFLITDLNLTTEESKNLNNDINTLNEDGYKITLQLLDHHATGSKSAKRYEWYYLDTTRSATKITYDYFLEHYKDTLEAKCEKNFEKLIQAVNAADIWIDDDPLFEYGKVCMSMVSKSNEVNNTIFPNDHREYKHYLLIKALEFIDKEEGYILLDEQVYFNKKSFLNQSQNNNTLDNLTSHNLVRLLDTKKEELTIHYKNYRGLLTYALGNISISANEFLRTNQEYDFFMDIGRRGRVGFRSNDKLDVSILAQKLAGGGGHPNASGTSFNDFKDTPLYEEVKKFVQNKLDNCE
jgi:uncharacterized protein